MAEKNLQLAQALGNGLEIARALNNSGEVLEKLDRDDEALTRYEKAYQLKMENGDSTLPSTRANLRRLYKQLGQTEKARDYAPTEPEPDTFWWRHLE